MKPKLLLVFLTSITFISDVYAERKHMEHMMIIHNADQNNDFRVSSNDIRDWAEAVAEIYNHKKPMMRMRIPALEYAEKFDKNRDFELSSTEERLMRDHFKKSVAKSIKKLFIDYDLNKNRRFDDKELSKLRSEIHNLTNYAIETSMGIKKKEEPKTEFRKEPDFDVLKPIHKKTNSEPVRTRKFDDIYD